MDIARLNLSHGEYSAHEKRLPGRPPGRSDATGRAVGILVDLQGPKIRTGRFADGPVLLKAGDRFTITTRRRGRRPGPGQHDVQGPAW
jgi:pyruvate kinase